MAFLATAFVLAHAGVAARAQAAPAGGIEGKLTDSYSRPLNGVQVTLRNAHTGVEFKTVTSKSGGYRLAGMVPGEYVLEASGPKLGHGRITGIVVPAGHAAHIQTALTFHPELPGLHATPAALDAALQPSPPSVQPFAPPAIHAAIIAKPSPVLSVASLPRSNRSGAALALAASTTAIAALGATASGLDTSIAAQLDPLLPQSDSQDVISADDLQALPVAARESHAFQVDTPPQVATGSEGAFAEASNAEPGDGAAEYVGGVSTRLPFGRGIGQRDRSAFIGPAATQAAVREVQIIGRYGVDGSGFPGREGRSVSTRSGADFERRRLHGQFFLFDKQRLLNARNPFSQWTRETTPASPGTLPLFSPVEWSPTDTSIRWGGAAGGPIRRNGVFWYGAFSQERRTDPALAIVRHPDHFFAIPANDEMQVLSARLGLSSADPVGEGLAAYGTLLETLSGLLGPAPRSSQRSAAFARFDWNSSGHHRFRLEGSGVQWNAPHGALTRVTEGYGNHSFPSVRSHEIWVTAAWDASFSANLLAISQAAFGRYSLQHPPATPSPFEQTLNVNPWGQLPQIVVDSRYGFSIGNPARFGAGTYPQESQIEVRQTLDWRRGRLSILAGAEFRENADATSSLPNHTGTYHYARLENFASDALSFAKFGLGDALDPADPHNCDQRGKAWRDSEGRLHGLGYLPCYSYYTQTLGPSNWHLETNDWAGFATSAWRARAGVIFSAGLRWDRQIMPPPIALVQNPDLPEMGKLPDPGNQWAPRGGVAFGSTESRWPVLAVGYGMYYGRVPNRTLEEALTQTGSPNGDLKLFLRPTNNLIAGAGGVPPFPYVLAGSPGTALKPGVSEVAPGFHNGEIHQAVASAEQHLPAHTSLSVSAVVALGRRLPVTVDTNFDPAVNPGTITYEVADTSKSGPIKTPQLTVPFFAAWPSAGQSGGRLHPAYQEIATLFSRANSTYEAGVLRLFRSSSRGVSFNVRYIYGHAMDWNPSGSGLLSGSDLQDPLNMRQEYGTSDLDIRHSVAGYAIWRAPWKLTGMAGNIADGWMLSGTGQFHSGLPYSMRTAGAIPEAFVYGGGFAIGLGPGMNGYGGSNRVYGLARNAYRYPLTWKADLRMGKRFPLGHERQLELMAESFNLFNHRNVTEIETVGYTIDTAGTPGSMPRLNFLTDVTTGLPEFGQPLNVNATDDYRERQFDLGLRLRFKH